MAIITRTDKGSKLTIAEMDGNLTTLNDQSFQDGVYSVKLAVEGGTNTATISVQAETNDIFLNSGVESNGGIASKLTFSPTRFITDTIVAGTYENIEPTVSDGSSGTGLVVTVVVVDVEGTPTIKTITVTSAGSGYAADDVLSIPTSALGAESSTEFTTCTLAAANFLKGSKAKFVLSTAGILVEGLPTSDPGVLGALWIDAAASHSLKVSQG